MFPILVVALQENKHVVNSNTHDEKQRQDLQNSKVCLPEDQDIQSQGGYYVDDDHAQCNTGKK